MNRSVTENEFRSGLEELLADVVGAGLPASTNPYADAGETAFHEHDTRVFFFDRLMRLLGWKLGQGGNVAEEARIKGESTNFVDYVGVNDDTRVPALILEAKSWGKPFITGRESWRGRASSELVIAAVEHINAGGAKNTSPVVEEWHDNLEQVARYVRRFKENHGHEVARAVLSSGQWLLIFKAPIATFCDLKANDAQICLLHVGDYVAQASLILEHMSRVALADTAPVRIRSSQLSNYVDTETFGESFHALLVRYERSGASIFDRMPRILVYPALLVQRTDGALFTVIDSTQPIEVPTLPADGDALALQTHLKDVSGAAETLRASCALELGIEIAPNDLSAFRGFPADPFPRSEIAIGTTAKVLVRALREGPDQWFVVTGEHAHFLLGAPQVDCRFHAWSACRVAGAAIEAGAVNAPRTEAPRTFFVDGTAHHCAHRVVDDRRGPRCHVQVIDAHVCCRICVFQDACWTEGELAALPCGK